MTNVTLHKVKRKRGSCWLLRWYGTDGKRYGETIGECGKVSKRDAESLRRDKQSKIDCGVVSPDKPKRTTLAQFAVFDRQLIADRRYKTLLNHDDATRLAKKVMGADLPVDKINRAHVAKLKAHMQAEVYSPATIDKVIRCLRAMWNRGKCERVVVANPFAGNGVKWEPGESRIFTPEEVDAMLEVAADDWGRVFIRLLVTSGMRLNEALHLRWADVDLGDGTVKVCRHDAGQFTAEGESYPLLPWSAKAKASYRTIPLPPSTVADLQRYKAKVGKSAYVFVDLDRLAAIDRKLQAGTLRPNYELVNNALRRFKTIQRKARALLAEKRKVKVEEVEWREGCIHDLRDTYLTGVKGLPIDVLQRVAGHADIATTIRFYTQATERDADAVRSAVARSGLAGRVQDTFRTHPPDTGQTEAAAVDKKPASRYHEPALSA